MQICRVLHKLFVKFSTNCIQYNTSLHNIWHHRTILHRAIKKQHQRDRWVSQYSPNALICSCSLLIIIEYSRHGLTCPNIEVQWQKHVLAICNAQVHNEIVADCVHCWNQHFLNLFARSNLSNSFTYFFVPMVKFFFRFLQGKIILPLLNIVYLHTQNTWKQYK